ncbi:LysR substrate-binding domain-containing protein [Cupriavidus oxalaticus]|uniref:LysR substrate-binding domain-containing protein n=1 Tax=Cupriavidus oxalaticus TaxID=96344 RepID=UPI003F73208B
MKLPPLNALRVFHVVGSTTSIRRAAAMLCVSHTAVARQIRELEGWFGVPLVQSGVRGTLLTPEGQTLFEHVSQAFAQLQQGVEAVRGKPPGRDLRVYASPGFATFWILPRLQALQSRLPGVAVSLLPTEQPPVFDAGGADVAVLYGGLPDDRFVNELLLRPQLVALATATWMGRHPQVRHAGDLLEVPLVHEWRHHEWENWFEALGHKVHRPLAGVRLGILPAALEAVCAGQGPGLFPAEFRIEESRGELKRVVPESAVVGAYYIVYPHRRQHDETLRTFREWIHEAMSSLP